MIVGRMLEEKNKPDFSQEEKIYGITSAISYLHSDNVVHWNLNPTNIYETEKLYPLLGNFENAHHLEE